MREVEFFEEQNNIVPINYLEKEYWTRMFKSNLKIGVEIEGHCAGISDYSSVIRFLRDKLKPNNTTYNFGDNGVYKVTTDGSITNGVELCTNGRRVGFIDLYSQYEYICGLMLSKGVRTSCRCGLHNHILLDYGSDYNCLEKPLNGIIFKNFINLFKRHYPELVWITSTVDETYCGNKMLTRGDRFCMHSSLFSNSVNKKIRNFKSSVMSGDRYKAINMNFLKIDDENDNLKNFHLELRFPDGSVYPAQIASQNVLYTAMLLKAIKLSEIGLITTGNDWAETKELTGAIRNQYVWSGDNRFSEPPTEQQINKIKERATDLISFLSPELESIDKRSIPVLNSLANEPISIMRRSKSVDEINDYFKQFFNSSYKDNTELDILKHISAMDIVDCMSEFDYILKLSSKVNKDVKDVTGIINNMKYNRNLKFNPILGSLVEI